MIQNNFGEGKYYEFKENICNANYYNDINYWAVQPNQMQAYI